MPHDRYNTDDHDVIRHIDKLIKVSRPVDEAPLAVSFLIPSKTRVNDVGILELDLKLHMYYNLSSLPDSIQKSIREWVLANKQKQE